MRSARRGRRRQEQRGFALLIVFLLAAAVAFSLYRQLPRAAFESMRDKEELLIDRGSQYRRAIEVYFAVNKRYPATLEDLEKSDKRYLRRRYKDPLTGKDEWRLIHTNGTTLTDSLVQKPGNPNALAGGALPGAGPLGTNSMNTPGEQAGFAAGGALGNLTSPPAASGSSGGAALAAAGFGNTPLPFAGGTPGQPPQVNAAVLRRPSDRIPLAAPTPQDPGDDAAREFDPNNLPPITLLPEQNPQQANTQQVQNPDGPPMPGQMLPGMLGAGPRPNAGANAPQDEPPGQNAPEDMVSIQPAFPPNPGFASPNPANQNPAQANVLGQFGGQGGMNPQPVFIPAPGANQNSGGQSRPLPGSQNLVTVGPGGQLIPLTSPNPQQAFSPSTGTGVAAGVGAPTGAAPVTPQGARSPAEILINNQLRTPGPQAASNQNANQPGANNLGSPGVAGVASTFEGPSIKTYAKREKYQEWEFVFDPAAARTALAPGAPGRGGQAGPLGPNSQQPNQNSPFGQPPGGGFGPPNPFSQPQQQGQPFGAPGSMPGAPGTRR